MKTRYYKFTVIIIIIIIVVVWDATLRHRTQNVSLPSPEHHVVALLTQPEASIMGEGGWTRPPMFYSVLTMQNAP